MVQINWAYGRFRQVSGMFCFYNASFIFEYIRSLMLLSIRYTGKKLASCSFNAEWSNTDLQMILIRKKVPLSMVVNYLIESFFNLMPRIHVAWTGIPYPTWALFFMGGCSVSWRGRGYENKCDQWAIKNGCWSWLRVPSWLLRVGMGLGVLFPVYAWRWVLVWGLSEGGETTGSMVTIIDLPGHGIDVCHSTRSSYTWHQDCGSL